MYKWGLDSYLLVKIKINTVMKTFNSIPVLAFIALLFVTSCSTTDAVFSDADAVLDRIDMVLEGPEVEHIYIQSEESSNLVNFAQHTQNDRMDFILTLDTERELVFSVTDKDNSEIWSRVGAGYSIFPTQHFEDKTSWVKANIISTRNLGDVISTSHYGSEYPREASLNVFRVVEFNPANNEVLCRVDGFPMRSLQGDNEVMITGTFRGKVTFHN